MIDRTRHLAFDDNALRDAAYDALAVEGANCSHEWSTDEYDEYCRYCGVTYSDYETMFDFNYNETYFRGRNA